MIFQSLYYFVLTYIFTFLYLILFGLSSLPRDQSGFVLWIKHCLELAVFYIFSSLGLFLCEIRFIKSLQNRNSTFVVFPSETESYYQTFLQESDLNQALLTEDQRLGDFEPGYHRSSLYTSVMNSNRSTQDTNTQTSQQYYIEALKASADHYSDQESNYLNQSTVFDLFSEYSQSKLCLLGEALLLCVSTACLKLSLSSSIHFWGLAVTIANYDAVAKALIFTRKKPFYVLIVFGFSILYIYSSILIHYPNEYGPIVSSAASTLCLTLSGQLIHSKENDAQLNCSGSLIRTSIQFSIGVILLLCLILITSTRSILVTELYFSANHQVSDANRLCIGYVIGATCFFVVSVWYLNQATANSPKTGEWIIQSMPFLALPILIIEYLTTWSLAAYNFVCQMELLLLATIVFSYTTNYSRPTKQRILSSAPYLWIEAI